MMSPSFNSVIKLGDRDMMSFNSVRAWMSALRGKDWTRVTYLRNLRDFCRWCGKTPDELVEERREGLRRDRFWRREEDLLNQFYMEMRERYSAGTCLSKFTAVASFFKYNGLRLEIPRFPKVESWEERGVKRLTKEEIRKMMGYADRMRDKLVLIIGAESGLRVKGLNALTLGCFVDVAYIRDKEGYIRSIDLTESIVPSRIELPKRFYFGRKSEGITFVCEDALELLKEYVERRYGWGEKLTEKSPVFPAYRATIRFLDGKKERKRVYLKSRYWPPGSIIDRVVDTSGRKYVYRKAVVEEISVEPISITNIERTVRKLAKRAGITYDPEKERPPSVHSLRKYLRSTLDAAGVNAVLVNTIIGHSSMIEEHYSGKKHLDIEELRHAYESAMHRIAISEKITTRSLKARLNHEEERREALERAFLELGSRVEKLEEAIVRLLGIMVLWGGPRVETLARELGLEKQFKEMKRRKGY